MQSRDSLLEEYDLLCLRRTDRIRVSISVSQGMSWISPLGQGEEKVSCAETVSNVRILCSVHLKLMLVKGPLLMVVLLNTKRVICALVGTERLATQRTDNGLCCLFSIRLG